MLKLEILRIILYEGKLSFTFLFNMTFLTLTCILLCRFSDTVIADAFKFGGDREIVSSLSLLRVGKIFSTDLIEFHTDYF